MRKRNAEFFLAMAQGAIIGAAGIIPGASGGVLAVSMGIYRSIVNAVLSLLKDFRKNFLYLLPFGLGGVAGILLTARGLAFLLANHRGALMYALMGMVLGGVPDLIRDANTGGFHKRHEDEAVELEVGAEHGGGGFLGLVGQCRHRWRGLALYAGYHGHGRGHPGHRHRDPRGEHLLCADVYGVI